MSPTSEACRDVREYIAAKNKPNPIAVAHAEAGRRLACLIPPRIYANPDPQEFEATSEYLLDVARIVDELILAVGREVKSSASVNIDITSFENVLRTGLEGFATYEISREVASIKEDRNAA